jgi:mannose/fructose-specific phosphotransferase system component IIA
MIGILIFTHGRLCMALRQEAERIAGHRDQVRCLSMSEGETYEDLAVRVSETVAAIDDGDGVLAVCDVAGGTPWNICGQLSDGTHRIRRVGGGGMPLLIKALQDRGEHTELDAWADELLRYAMSRTRSG